MAIQFPKIYLAVDNCFAAKRWTRPADWLQLVKDWGVNFVEASADNECDPLYTPSKYLQQWLETVAEEADRRSMKIANFYSGHGTYSTIGLGHYDSGVRNHIRDNWLKTMIDSAAKLDTGFGFFCHAFDQSILNSQEEYQKAYFNLITDLQDLAFYAFENGLKSIGLEQMYTPHQIPWTIDGARQLLQEVSSEVAPFFITLDVGHQSGQHKFQWPEKHYLLELVNKVRAGADIAKAWLGSAKAYDKLHGGIEENLADEEIMQLLMNDIILYPHLFAQAKDTDTYAWLESLGCYSPIVHLQQTDGKTSAHWPFTEENNQKGIVEPEKVLQTLYQSYLQNEGSDLPQCQEIFLTLEIFAKTADIPMDILRNMEQSVAYWRKFIPEDGVALDKLTLQIKD